MVTCNSSPNPSWWWLSQGAALQEHLPLCFDHGTATVCAQQVQLVLAASHGTGWLRVIAAKILKPSVNSQRDNRGHLYFTNVGPGGELNRMQSSLYFFILIHFNKNIKLYHLPYFFPHPLPYPLLITPPMFPNSRIGTPLSSDYYCHTHTPTCMHPCMSTTHTCNPSPGRMTKHR